MSEYLIYRHVCGVRNFFVSQFHWEGNLMLAMVFKDLKGGPTPKQVAAKYGGKVFKLPGCRKVGNTITKIKDDLNAKVNWDITQELDNAEEFILEHDLLSQYREFLLKKAAIDIENSHGS